MSDLNIHQNGISRKASDGYISKIIPSSNFTTLHNKMLQDHSMSFAARGLLAYMISLPEDWKIKRSHLSHLYQGERKKGHGQDAIDSMFKELINAEYVVYEKVRQPDGSWSHNYRVYPVKFPQFQKMFPEEDNPLLVNPVLDNPPLYKEKNLTKERIYKEKKEEEKNPPPGGVGGGDFLTFGEHKNCRLTPGEYEKLKKELPPDELSYWIEEIDIAVGTAGGHDDFCKKYKIKSKTHYFTILAWRRKRKADGKSFDQMKTKNVISKHRQGSILAYEKKIDEWIPPGWTREEAGYGDKS